MDNEGKLRLLYLWQYLKKYSDKDHTVTTNELLKLINEKYGITTHRTTIPNDFSILEEVGIHISSTRGRQSNFYYDSHPFDVAELKILIDSVAASKFITRKKSTRLCR